MKAISWTVGLVLLVAVVAAGGFFAFAWRPGVAAADPPSADAFSQEEIARGEMLAAVGACEVCHTRVGGGAFAGGRPLETPFGIIHSTNITPDPQTGIGRWSLEAFERSMREGVARSGKHLYPAFPYTHFARATDEDIAAIYAFLMSREPISTEAPANELEFPANMRPLLAGWKLLFHDASQFQADPEQSETVNRGAYLVEGLGHCSACHSPRNALGAIPEGQEYTGGVAEGWYSFALDETAPAPVPWSDIALVNYLLDGWDLDHGVAAGPMQAVVNHLSAISEDDAFAMAEYLLSLKGEQPSEGAREDAIAFAESRQFGGGGRDRVAEMSGNLARGAQVFEEICANCHNAASQTVPLGLTSTVHSSDPRNVIHIILEGIDAPQNSPNKSMRAFGATVDDEALHDLMTFLRDQFTQKDPWPNLNAHIDEIRRSGE